jgi:hypothetical protein
MVVTGIGAAAGTSAIDRRALERDNMTDRIPMSWLLAVDWS